ncbi:MAG: hypothetical protein VX819_07450 [Pseudomonadota bacterium]|nr:hypothetical protein [Pseudomonadota bacterium]
MADYTTATTLKNKATTAIWEYAMQMYKMSLLLAVALVAGTAQAGTEEEIRDVVKANISHTNKTMSQDPTRISKDGSKEFFSSGGLLNTIQRDSDASDFEYFSGSVKHIEVVVLVEGQAAVAHYYQEATMKPKGLPAVPNYRTRVTQAFVKEDGMWRIKAAHWSPLQGGAGTSQTVVK